LRWFADLALGAVRATLALRLQGCSELGAQDLHGFAEPAELGSVCIEAIGVRLKLLVDLGHVAGERPLERFGAAAQPFALVALAARCRRRRRAAELVMHGRAAEH
jgi:hypothetical protein